MFCYYNEHSVPEINLPKRADVDIFYYQIFAVLYIINNYALCYLAGSCIFFLFFFFVFVSTILFFCVALDEFLLCMGVRDLSKKGRRILGGEAPSPPGQLATTNRPSPSWLRYTNCSSSALHN